MHIANSFSQHFPDQAADWVCRPSSKSHGVPVYIQGFLKDNHIKFPEDRSDAVARVRHQIEDDAGGHQDLFGRFRAAQAC